MTEEEDRKDVGELETAAYIWSSKYQVEDHRELSFEHPIDGSTWNYMPDEVDIKAELVRRGAAEEASKDAYSEGFWKGFEKSREHVSELIDQRITAFRKRINRLEQQEEYKGDKELELAKAKALFDSYKELREEVDSR